MENSFLSDDQLWQPNSPTQDQEYFEEEELTELQIEVAENRKLKAKIQKVLPKLDQLKDLYGTTQKKYFENEINEIINDLK